MAIVIGLVFILFSIWAVLPLHFPFSLGWGHQVVVFLQGALPILFIFIGLIAVFIGLADLKDKRQAKKEAQAEKDKNDSNQA